MSYSFSLSGHVDTQDGEWTLIKQLAAAVQSNGGTVSGAVGNTQFHGVVDLTKVQVVPAQPSEAPPTEPVVDPAVQAAAVIPSPPVPPVQGPPAPEASLSPHATDDPAWVPEAPLTPSGPVTGLNAAGEVVEANETNSETVAPDAVPQPNQITIAEPVHNAQGEVVGFVEGTHQSISTVPTETQSDPLYNAAGEVVGYK